MTVLDMLDALDDDMMSMMITLCYLNMTMFFILSMLYDNECHIASCQ